MAKEADSEAATERALVVGSAVADTPMAPAELSVELLLKALTVSVMSFSARAAAIETAAPAMKVVEALIVVATVLAVFEAWSSAVMLILPLVVVVTEAAAVVNEGFHCIGNGVFGHATRTRC